MKNGLIILIGIAFLALSCTGDLTEGNYLPITQLDQPGNTSSEIPEKTELSHETATLTWITEMQQENGLLESAEYTNFVSLYDNSLAALVFMFQGETERAERIFDFFEAQMTAELFNGSGGFYQFRNREGKEGSRTWMGDNAWLLIALQQYRELSGSSRYSEMADGLESWLRSLQDTDGGLWGGFNDDGTQIPKVTEGMITAFNAVPGYDDFHKGILQFLSLRRWDPVQKVLLTQKQASVYQYALDLHSLGYLILEDFPKSTLHESDRYLNTQTATLSGVEMTGYGFDQDQDVIWLEGSAQMALAFSYAGLTNDAQAVTSELEKSFIQSTIANGAKGLPYTANFGTNFGAVLLWDHADISPALSSSIWYLFAKNQYNPLLPGRMKSMPEEDKFWKTPVQ